MLKNKNVSKYTSYFFRYNKHRKHRVTPERIFKCLMAVVWLAKSFNSYIHGWLQPLSWQRIKENSFGASAFASQTPAAQLTVSSSHKNESQQQ